jgi:hypothetical protein
VRTLYGVASKIYTYGYTGAVERSSFDLHTTRKCGSSRTAVAVSQRESRDVQSSAAVSNAPHDVQETSADAQARRSHPPNATTTHEQLGLTLLTRHKFCPRCLDSLKRFPRAPVHAQMVLKALLGMHVCPVAGAQSPFALALRKCAISDCILQHAISRCESARDSPSTAASPRSR